MNLALAIGIGTVFGFVLHRTGAADPSRIKGMLALRDLHLAKVILFAIGLSSALLFVGLAAGLINPAHLSVKSNHVGVIVGGLVFGVGFAVAGFCPGTAVCAVGGGDRRGLFFVVGGLLGAALFAGIFEILRDTPIMAKLGGKISVVASHSSTGLLDGTTAIIAAIAVAVVFMGVAWLLPSRPQRCMPGTRDERPPEHCAAFTALRRAPP